MKAVTLKMKVDVAEGHEKSGRHLEVPTALIVWTLEQTG